MSRFAKLQASRVWNLPRQAVFFQIDHNTLLMRSDCCKHSFVIRNVSQERITSLQSSFSILRCLYVLVEENHGCHGSEMSAHRAPLSAPGSKVDVHCSLDGCKKGSLAPPGALFAAHTLTQTNPYGSLSVWIAVNRGVCTTARTGPR